LHGASLDGATLTDADLRDADISGDIERLRINGVEIEPLVRAELDRRFPERVLLRAIAVEGLRDAWSMLEDRWAAATERAATLGDELAARRVNGEWSFVETLRHLIFATDSWLSRAVLQARHPYHPWGLPWSGAGADWTSRLGIDTSATPNLAEILPVRAQRQQAVRTALGTLTDDDLAEIRMAPDDPGHPTGQHAVLECVHVLLREEWEHHRYAMRDLDELDG
jgi:hypothetical protein